jgi:hypothetical protein
MSFPLSSPSESVTHLSPLLTPLLTSAHLRSLSLAVDPHSHSPFVNLRRWIRLGPRGSPLRTSLPISPEVQIGLFEMRSLGIPGLERSKYQKTDDQKVFMQSLSGGP